MSLWNRGKANAIGRYSGNDEFVPFVLGADGVHRTSLGNNIVPYTEFCAMGPDDMEQWLEKNRIVVLGRMGVDAENFS